MNAFAARPGLKAWHTRGVSAVLACVLGLAWTDARADGTTAPRGRKADDGGAAYVIREVERIEASPGDREADIEALLRVLAEVRSHPLAIADSPAAHESRLRALLLLARRQLERGQIDAATEAVDEAIRTARGEPLPRGFGDPIDAMVSRRIGASDNAPRGTVSVQCGTPCRVILDERDAGSGAAVITRGVPLGTHRLHVTALSGQGTNDQPFVLTLEQPRFEVTLFTATPAITQEDPPAEPTDTGTAADLPPERKLPRWAGIVGITASSALLLSGGVLLGLDGRCTDGRSASTRCPDLLETGVGGGILLGVGVAGVVGFSIAFGIAESRSRKRARP